MEIETWVLIELKIHGQNFKLDSMTIHTTKKKITGKPQLQF